MIEKLNDRLKSLKKALRVLVKKHRELHDEVFGENGTYKELSKEYPVISDSPIGKQIRYFKGEIKKIKKEILAISYYKTIMNTKNVSKVIHKTINTINEYGYLGSEVDLSDLIVD